MKTVVSSLARNVDGARKVAPFLKGKPFDKLRALRAVSGEQ
jgi:hypothetical protein